MSTLKSLIHIILLLSSKGLSTVKFIQPIVVRKKKTGYEIVAGERRWRAAMKAELSEVPCLIREL
ncbi:MAG: ParB N-terminal domain-containing protein, partial [Bacteroidales bacterium]|nr:ParB N-terminal domain-containing protein [Bacteroidales bacterium]